MRRITLSILALALSLVVVGETNAFGNRRRCNTCNVSHRTTGSCGSTSAVNYHATATQDIVQTAPTQQIPEGAPKAENLPPQSIIINGRIYTLVPQNQK